MQNHSDTDGLKKRLFIAGVVFSVVGGLMLGGAMLAAARVNATANWPSTNGRITTSENSTATIKTGRVARSEPIAKVVYTYSVQGRRYECDRRRVIPMLHSKTPDPQEVLARYPVGRNVKVYYDANNPNDALLTPIPAKDAKILMSWLKYCGPLLALIGIGMMVGGAEAVFPGAGRVLTTLPRPLQTVTQNVASPKPLPARPKPIVTRLKTRRETHWLVRIIACVVGALFLLFGGLVVLVSISMLSDAVNHNAAHYVVVVIFTGVTCLGAYMIRIGFWQRARAAL